MLSFKFTGSVGVLSLLAGSHLSGTCCNYLKPYSLFIPHFARVVCCLAWIARSAFGTTWPVTSNILDLQPPWMQSYHQPASGKAPSVNTSQRRQFQPFVWCLVYCLCRRVNVVLPLQIIANHFVTCSQSMMYFKIVILKEDAPRDAQRKRSNEHVGEM